MRMGTQLALMATAAAAGWFAPLPSMAGPPYATVPTYPVVPLALAANVDCGEFDVNAWEVRYLELPGEVSHFAGGNGRCLDFIPPADNLSYSTRYQTCHVNQWSATVCVWSEWSAYSPRPCSGDVDGDGVVGWGDFNIVRRLYGNVCTQP